MMAKETKEIEPTEKITTKKAVSSSKKTTTATRKKATSKVDNENTAIKKAVTKKATTKKASSTAEKASASNAKKTSAKKADTSTTKKATTKKASSTAKKASASNAKKTSIKKADTSASKKVSTKKASSTTKKVTTKKASSVKKSSLEKTVSSQKTTKTSKRRSSPKAVSNQLVSEFQAEYYDLPYMYNKTIVKILAQSPKMLFIYWEISEDDRNLFKKLYGENFFNNTKPILVVYNDTMNYSFEVEIDDFANSWYLHINDANCDYHVELGRKPIQNKVQQNQSIYIPYYVYVTSSNEIASPNNRILFDPKIKTIRFRNVKTGEIKEKDITQFIFITNFGIFNIKELYTYLFPNESFEFENIVLGNTSSGALSSSGMFSSQFK